jgi:hypothetical protein
MAAAAFAGCGGSSEPDSVGTTAKGRETMAQELHARIAELGGQDAYPVVPLDLFFEGNDDPASFAPNLEPHPGIERIYAVLRGVAQRPDVSAVVVQIDEVLDPPEWPYASAVYVITSAEAADVHRWASSITPDDSVPESEEDYGWLTYADRDRATPPPGAPEVPDGHRSVILFWD